MSPRMDNLTFDKAQILEALNANRAEHKNKSQEAFAAYTEQMTNQLEQHLQNVRDGMRVSQHIHIKPPADHTLEYDTAIDMLEWCNEERVCLSRDEYQKYVLDEWD